MNALPIVPTPDVLPLPAPAPLLQFLLHLTFLLLLGFLAVNAWVATRSLEAALTGVLFFLLLFACVLLHEFGHALTAARYGIRTRDIVLYPIGGVARLERMPENPAQELVVALAAVAVLAIAGLVAGFAVWGGGEEVAVTPAQPDPVVAEASAPAAPAPEEPAPEP